MNKPGVKAFIIYNKKLLWILRDNNPNIPSPNTWNLPGGGIEEGESGIEALKRELQEEINIIPRNILYLGEQTFEDDSRVLRYLIKLTPDEYKNLKLGNEGQKMDFFSIDETLKLDLAGHSKKYFEKYKNQIEEIVEKNKIPQSKLLGLVKHGVK